MLLSDSGYEKVTQGRTNWGGTLRKEVPGRNYSPTNKKQEENKLQWQDNFPNIIKQQKNGVTFCDGAAGSQVPQVVIDRMTDHLKTLGSTNITYDHSLGTSAVQVVSKARQGYKH
jgi:selenocysteine lyase/cysteine desulfurase